MSVFQFPVESRTRNLPYSERIPQSNISTYWGWSWNVHLRLPRFMLHYAAIFGIFSFLFLSWFFILLWPLLATPSCTHLSPCNGPKWPTLCWWAVKPQTNKQNHPSKWCYVGHEKRSGIVFTMCFFYCQYLSFNYDLLNHTYDFLNHTYDFFFSMALNYASVGFSYRESEVSLHCLVLWILISVLFPSVLITWYFYIDFLLC